MKYVVGDVITGTVSGVKQYGIFVKIEDTFGFCHISNCSHKFIKNLNELFPIGSEIKAKIIELDETHDRFNISIKDYENQNKPQPKKYDNEKSKSNYKKSNQFEKSNNNVTISSFDDMLKTYLKHSEEQLACIGKRNQKHNKR